MADLQKNAEYTGLTAERFQSIQFAAGQGGVSSDQSADDLRNVARLLADAKENENSLTKLLDANNIKYKDRNDQVITLNQLLGIAGGLINKFDSITEKVKAAQMLGLSEQWVEALRNGSTAFEDIASGADQAGAIIDNATVAKAADFDRAWKQSSDLLGKQFKSVAADIGGWLDGLIDKANDLVAAALASQNVQSGSGQETFNRWADAADRQSCTRVIVPATSHPATSSKCRRTASLSIHRLQPLPKVTTPLCCMNWSTGHPHRSAATAISASALLTAPMLAKSSSLRSVQLSYVPTSPCTRAESRSRRLRRQLAHNTQIRQESDFHRSRLGTESY